MISTLSITVIPTTLTLPVYFIPADCHQITAEELGIILQKLEATCPQCLIKRMDSNEVEVNVDLVPGSIFREIRGELELYLPWDNQQRRKVKRLK